MRQSFGKIFSDARSQIAKAFDIDARTSEILKEKDNKDMALAQKGLKENLYWAGLKIFSRTVAANFLWPILTPIFVLFIKLPIQLLHHATMTLFYAASSFISKKKPPQDKNSNKKSTIDLETLPTKKNNSNSPSCLYGCIPSNLFKYAYSKFCKESETKQKDASEEDTIAAAYGSASSFQYHNISL